MAISGRCLIAIAGFFLSACLLPLTKAIAAEVDSGITPIEKVIQLLEKLGADIDAEGQEEAKKYDKYACWCKDSATTKKLDIEKSEAKINELNTDLGVLDSEIDDLTGAISELTTKISDAVKAKADAKKAREEAHEAFKGEETDYKMAIDYMQGALGALKQSKGELKQAKLGLTEFQNLAALADKMRLHHQAAMLRDASMIQTKGAHMQPPVLRYEYSGNGIIEMIEQLKRLTISNIKTLREDEFKENSQWEKEDASTQRDIKFFKIDKKEKEKVLAKKSQIKAEKVKDLDLETKNKGLDEDFLAELTEDCQDKSRIFDERSTARADERKILFEAETAVKEKVAPKAGGLKKIYFLQESAILTHRVVKQEARRSTLSLLQVSRRRDQAALLKKQQEAMVRARSLLLEASNELGSSALLAAYARMTGYAPDQFENVRETLKDLITRLNTEATAEETYKTTCDEYLTITNDAPMAIEELRAEQAVKKSEHAELLQAIAKFEANIAMNEKLLMEATELSAEQTKQNEANIQMCTEGKDGIELAINVVNTYYSFAQINSNGAKVAAVNAHEVKAAKAASKQPTTLTPGGQLVEDIYKGKHDYEKKTEGSVSIIALFDTILADFERQIAKTQEEQQKQLDEFNDETKPTLEGQIQADKDDKEADGQQATSLYTRLLQIEEELEEEYKTDAAAKKKLEELRKICAKPADHKGDYAKRVADREQEIKGLQQAYEILTSWNK